MLLFISIIINVILLIYSGYTLLIKKYDYWKNKGVNGPTPYPVVGNFGNIMLMKESIASSMKTVHLQYPNDKVVGIYRGFTPMLLVRDPELIKQVTIKDFHVFQDRGVKTSSSPLADNLFGAEGETWRILRQKLTPTFTSKKLKDMMPLIETSVESFVNHIDKLVENYIDCEIKSLMAKYTLDVIGSCAFGLNLNVYSDEKNAFREMAHKIFTPSMTSRLLQILNMIIPGIRKKVTIPGSTEIDDFFLNLVNSIVSEREGKTSTRKDFMDLMIELKEQGRASRRDESGISEIDINNGMIAAQALVFYSAGFETSSSTMSFLLHELALHQDIQNKMYSEICDATKKHNGMLNYESLKDLPYMKMVFDETLRKYSVAGVLIRVCSANYTFPGTDIMIEKGTPILISPSGLNNDPRYFKNPEIFDPENFSPENIQKIPQCVYLPFGAGPRNCIGMRFAEVQSMIGLAAFLKNFKVEPSAKTKANLEFDPKGLILSSIDGIWMKISKR